MLLQTFNHAKSYLRLQYKTFPSTRNKKSDVSFPPMDEEDDVLSVTVDFLLERLLDFSRVTCDCFLCFSFWNVDEEPRA